MHRAMDSHQITPGSNYTGPGLLIIMWINTLMTLLEKANITFILSTGVSIIAGYYYLLQIKKTRRDLKNKNPNNEKIS
jgi:hypothetical protein